MYELENAGWQPSRADLGQETGRGQAVGRAQAWIGSIKIGDHELVVVGGQNANKTGWPQLGGRPDLADHLCGQTGGYKCRAGSFIQCARLCAKLLQQTVETCAHLEQLLLGSGAVRGRTS